MTQAPQAPRNVTNDRVVATTSGSPDSGATSTPSSAPNTDIWSVLHFLGLMLLGLAVLILGVMDFNARRHADLLALGVLSVIIPLSIYPVVRLLQQQRAMSNSGNSAMDPQAIELLRALNEKVVLSDNAKRIIHRDRDLGALRDAIREDINAGKYDSALVMTSQLAQSYGYLEESEHYRQEIDTLRQAALDKKISSEISRIDGLLELHDWEKAAYESSRVQRLYPDSPRVAGLSRRVREAREGFKQDLERQFLEASKRDEVERAMELLKVLDKYLTPEEAAPFVEVARGVIGKKRENLYVQFKLAVQDKEWTTSVAVGEQMIREFPNSKMANEVRAMLDVLRERAMKEQAARAGQPV